MQNRYTARQVCLMQQLRQLWEQHVYWTRFFIISTAASLTDPGPVTDRLLQNPKDFARALTPFFGARTAGQFGDLLTEHLEIGSELVTDLKNRETAKADDARRRWYANADAISAFLAGINTCWSEDKWRELLDDGKRDRAASAGRLYSRHPYVRPGRDRGAAHGRLHVLRSCHALPLNAQALPAGMTPEGSAFHFHSPKPVPAKMTPRRFA